MIEIVCATRLSTEEFGARSALGQSLQRLAFDHRIAVCLAPDNRSGLPQVYNARIGATGGPDCVVFMHDDVWIDDYYFVDRIASALDVYDVIGVAGNRRRVPRQPNWALVGVNLTWDDAENLSGAVAHGARPFGEVSRYGLAPADCELLDGLLLAARRSTLRRRGVRFDPRFDFHFYDMDFCRGARQQGLRLGTWPICVTHQSGGAFGSARWHAMYRLYLDKWVE